MRLGRGLRWLLPAILGIATAVCIGAFGNATRAAAQASLSISVSGNHLVDASGQTIQLRGVNVSSTEYACADGDGFADDFIDSPAADDATAAAIAGWGANVVRIPLNEDCWLNKNLPDATFGGAGYQQAIENLVSSLNAHGIYAILDLHYSAPGNQLAQEQQPMPDTDHSPAFWTSVATTFKANHAVIFDLFNEPYDPTDTSRSGDDQNANDAVTWGCWETGTKPDIVGGGATDPCDTLAVGTDGNGTTHYQIAGMQSLLDDVRNTGATQPIMTGGLDFADDLGDTPDANSNGQGWMQHAPDDPLNQEIASFHNYQAKNCDNQACWDSSVAAVAAHVPVITGEFAEDNYAAPGCQAASGADTFDTRYMNWADANGVSYLAWVWLVDDPPMPGDDTCNLQGLLSNYNGTPLAPHGTAVHDHLSALAFGTTSTTTAAVTPPPASTSTNAAGSGATTTTTTRTTTTTAKPKPKPAVSLRSFTAHLQPGGSTVKFALRTAQKSAGTISGLTVNTYTPATAKKHKPAKVSLGSVRFSLKANRSTTVVLKLSTASKHLLAAKRALKVQFTITLTSSGHRRTVLHRTTTLRFTH